MKTMYKLNKKVFANIYDLEDMIVQRIEKKSGVDHRALKKLIYHPNPLISEVTAQKLAKAYNIKKYDLILCK